MRKPLPLLQGGKEYAGSPPAWSTASLARQQSGQHPTPCRHPCHLAKEHPEAGGARSAALENTLHHKQLPWSQGPATPTPPRELSIHRIFPGLKFPDSFNAICSSEPGSLKQLDLGW